MRAVRITLHQFARVKIQTRLFFEDTAKASSKKSQFENLCWFHHYSETIASNELLWKTTRPAKAYFIEAHWFRKSEKWL